MKIRDYVILSLGFLFLVGLWYAHSTRCEKDQLEIMLRQKKESLESGSAAWTKYEEEYLQKLKCDCGWE